MGILDDAINQSNANRSNISVNAQNSLARVANAIDSANSARVPTIVENSADDSNETYSAIDSADRSLSYLNKQKQKYQDLQNEKGLFSYSNMNESNAGVELGLRGLSLLGRAGATVADAGVGVYGALTKKLYDTKINDMDPRVVSAYNKTLQGAELTSEEQSLLDSPYAGHKVNSNPLTFNGMDALDYALPSQGTEGATNKQILDAHQSGINDVREVEGKNGSPNVLGTSNWYSHQNENAFNESAQPSLDIANKQMDNGEYWNAFKTTASGNLDAVQKNPAYVSDLIAGSAPFMVKGVTVPLSIADGVRQYNESTNQYRDREKVVEPSTIDKIGMGAMSAAYAGLNFVSGQNLRKGLGIVDKTPTVATALADDAAKAVSKTKQDLGIATPKNGKDLFGQDIPELGTFDTGRISGMPTKGKDLFGEALAETPTNPNAIGGIASKAGGLLSTAAGLVASPVAHIAKHAGSEAVTEGIQTQIENKWGSLDPTIDVVGATQGAVLGGVMGGTVGIPGTVSHGVKDVIGKVADGINDKQAKDVNDKIGSSDTATVDLIDPQSEHFAPYKAINRTTMDILSRAKNNDTDIDYDTAKTTVDQARTAMADTYSAMQKDFKYASDPTKLESNINKGIASFDNGIANTDDPTKKDALEKGKQSWIDNWTPILEKARNADPDAIKKTLDDMKSKYDDTEKAHAQFMQEYSRVNSNSANSNSDADSDMFGSPSPEHLPRIEELLNDSNTDDATKTRLRMLKDAIVAENQYKDLGSITNAVERGYKGRNGDNNYRGMNDYISQTNDAVNNGDTSRLDILNRDIDAFETNLKDKNEKLIQAQNMAVNTGNTYQVVRNTDSSGWNTVSGGSLLSDIKIRKNGGLTVKPMKDTPDVATTDKVQKAIDMNLDSISKTKALMADMQGRDSTNSSDSIEDVANKNINDILNSPTTTSEAPQQTEQADSGQYTPDIETSPVSDNTAYSSADTQPNTDSEPTPSSTVDNHVDLNNSTDDPNTYESKLFDSVYDGSNVITNNQQMEANPELANHLAEGGYLATGSTDDKTGTKWTYLPKSNTEETNHTFTAPDGAVKAVNVKRDVVNNNHVATISDVATGKVDKNIPIDASIDTSSNKSIASSVIANEQGKVGRKVNYNVNDLSDENRANLVQRTKVATAKDDVENATNSYNDLRKSDAPQDKVERAIATLNRATKKLADLTGEKHKPIKFKSAVKEANTKEKVNAATQPVNKQGTEVTLEPSIDNEVTYAVTPDELIDENTPIDLSEATSNDIAPVTLVNKVADTAPAGVITALGTDGYTFKNSVEAERVKEFTLQNLVKSGFVQRTVKGFNSPLVTTKDYLKNHTAGVSTRAEYREVAKTIIAESTGSSEATKAQIDSLTSFLLFKDKYGDSIKDSIKSSHYLKDTGIPFDKYSNKNFNQYLLNSDGSLDDNVVSAISLAIYGYMGTAESTLASDPAFVSKTLGTKNKKEFTGYTLGRLRDVGTYQNTLMEQLGGDVLRALQLRSLKDVDSARSNKLQQSLGAAAVYNMLNAGLVERTNIAISELEALKQFETKGDNNPQVFSTANKNASVIYVRPMLENNEDKFRSVTPLIKSIARESAKSGSILSDVFGTSNVTMPSIKPIKTVPTQFSKILGKVSDFQKGVLLKQQTKVSYQLNIPLVNALDNLMQANESQVKKALGSVNTDEVIQGRLDSALSINNNIDRSINTLFDTESHTGDSKFYLPLSVWSQNRSGVTSIFNPQGDKLHRGMSFLSSDIATVKSNELKDTYTYNTDNYGNMDSFLKALGLRLEDMPTSVLGDNLASTDKELNSRFLPALFNYIHTDEIKNASLAMVRIADGKHTQADTDAVFKVLNGSWESETGAGGISALKAIGDYHIAKQKTKDGTPTNFHHVIFGESDGSNNGPAIINTLFGILTPNIRMPGGLFKQGEVKNLVEYRALGHSDLYQQLGNEYARAWEEYSKENSNPAIQAINLLDIDAGTRKGAKRILVPFNYGGGFDAILRSNSLGMIDSMYKRVNKAILSSNLADIELVTNSLNALIKHANSKSTNQVKLLTKERIGSLGFELNSNELGAILKADANIRAHATEQSLTTLLGSFISKRTEATTVANTAFELFEPIYNNAIQEAQDKFASENPDKVALGEKMPATMHDEVMNSLKEFIPSLKVPMGMESNQGVDSSIPLMNIKKSWTLADDKANRIEPSFIGSPEKLYSDKSSVKFRDKQGKQKGSKTTTLYSVVNATKLESPGVSSLAKYVQSHDAYISMKMMAKYNVQNFHDANAINAGKLLEMAKYQNQVFFEAMYKSHMGKTFTEATLKPLAKYSVNSANLLTTSLSKLAKQYNVEPSSNTKDTAWIATTLTRMVNSQFSGDLEKLNGLKDIVSVNQYATENGEYTPTAEDMNNINSEIEKLAVAYKQALDNVNSIVKNISGSNNTTKPAVTTSSKGPSSIQDKLLNGRDKITDATKLASFVRGFIKDSGVKDNATLSLFTAITSMAPKALKDVKVNILTHIEAKAQNANGYAELGSKGADGWYISGKDKSITLLVGDSSKLDSKIVVHELHHAMTVEAIAQARAESATPESKRALADLESILEYVKNNMPSDASSNLKYAVKSVEEFVSVGLVYPDVIKHLANTPINNGRSYYLGKGITTALRAVVTATMNLISRTFKIPRAPAKAVNSLEALNYTVANLLNGDKNVDGSASTNLNLFGSPFENAQNKVKSMSATDVYDALEDKKPNDPHRASLNLFMKEATDTLFSFNKHDNNFTVDDIWNDALQTGQAPHTTDALNAGFVLDNREQFAVEAIELATSAQLGKDSTSIAYTQISKAFESAKAVVKPSDFYSGNWLQATLQDKALAKKQYDYIFDTKNNDYLARFTALTVASKTVSDIMNVRVKDAVIKAETGNAVYELAVNYANTAISFATNKLTQTTPYSNANTRVYDVARKLVALNQKNKNKAVKQIESTMESIDSVMNNAVIKTSLKAYDLAHRVPVDQSNRTASFIKNAVKAYTGGKPFEAFKLYGDMINSANKNKTLGFIGELNNEVGKPSEEARTASELLRYQKLNETNAQRLRVTMANTVNSFFKDGGVNLTLDQRRGVTNSLLRTDAQHLVKDYGTKGIARLLQDTPYLNAEIARVIKTIPDQNHAKRAKLLGKYMVSTDGHLGLAKSAYAIAVNVGFVNADTKTKPDTDLVHAIDTLASLYAIKYTSKDNKVLASEVISSEHSKGNYGGIDTLLAFHGSMVNDSKNALFESTPINYIKGYLPDSTNPHKDIVIARNQADADRLTAAFYKDIGPLSKDQHDTTPYTPRMFYTEDSEQQNVLSGAMVLFNYGRRGSEVNLSKEHVQDLAALAQQSIENMPMDYDPDTDTTRQMIPNYNATGQVAGFSYEMSHKTKDTYLERDNDFAYNLGNFNAQGYSKLANVRQNNTVIDSLKEAYQSAKGAELNKYVYVGYNSKDSVSKEAWSRLSKETKESVKESWGSYGMWVPNDAFLTVFGYTKINATNIFDKDSNVRNVAENMFVELMKAMFGKNARVAVGTAHTGWQEAVKLMKNIVVIRNLVTSVNNMTANTFLLAAHGVPMSDIVTNTIKATRGAIQYRKDMSLLTSYEIKQRANVGDVEENASEIARLQNKIRKNPMNDFISMGMNPGIVEDIDNNQDRFSYQSKLAKKAEGMYNIIPKPIRRVGEYAFVTPSTPLYQFLHSSIQYSDFSAKYVLYNYLTENKKVDSNKALNVASDNFIDYDIPSSKYLQYANDMGLVMFTKYNIRIQKALFSLIAKRPASAIGQALMVSAHSNLPYGIDPIVFNHIGNPLRLGAFGLFDSLSEPFPLKLLF